LSIRNLRNYIRNLWDWGFLEGAFGTSNIGVTDVDGLIEHNGKFLFIEAKSTGAPVPLGQRILFSRLVEDPRFTVVVIWGDAPDGVQSFAVWGKKAKRGDTDAFKRWVSEWFEKT
jgi:hypothetical protein